MAFSQDSLRIDANEKSSASARACATRSATRSSAAARSSGSSGGIDSSVVAALCVRALGKERVLGLLMHERESSDETRRLEPR